ncbi:hypothetical protein I4641_17675 [Waterburya agarophytonicola K14]|uniref:Uncharacterized protein n=1 Tax=Waterburya agarophytonicola KI4 TaxID=2874699 RepID=A0A964BVF7_9CYAN|nr:hypothetical protein [Waterburya agarophytonicola]MCC0178802.1 hypothetical protein [Waterburya agarophytonicola KI4]
MIITRNIIAVLLETRPNNIKNLRQIENNIYIQLRDCDNELSMTLQEYENCLQQLKSSQYHFDSTQFITIMAIVGTFVFVALSSMNANLIGEENSQSQIELTADR